MKMKELLDENELKSFDFHGEEDALLFLFKIIDKPTDEKRAIAIDDFFGEMIICLARKQFIDMLKIINDQYIQDVDKLNTQILFTLPHIIEDATQERYFLQMGNQVKETFKKFTDFATKNNLPWSFDDDYIINIISKVVPSTYPLELAEYDTLVTQYVTSAKPINFLIKYINGNIIEELKNRASRHQTILNCHTLTRQALAFNNPFISTQGKNQIILKAYQLATTYHKNIKWHTKIFEFHKLQKEKKILTEMARTIVTMRK